MSDPSKRDLFPHPLTAEQWALVKDAATQDNPPKVKQLLEEYKIQPNSMHGEVLLFGSHYHDSMDLGRWLLTYDGWNTTILTALLDRALFKDQPELVGALAPHLNNHDVQSNLIDALKHARCQRALEAWFDHYPVSELIMEQCIAYRHHPIFRRGVGTLDEDQCRKFLPMSWSVCEMDDKRSGSDIITQLLIDRMLTLGERSFQGVFPNGQVPHGLQPIIQQRMAKMDLGIMTSHTDGLGAVQGRRKI